MEPCALLVLEFCPISISRFLLHPGFAKGSEPEFPSIEAQCGLSPEKRFSFYDHVHTTGQCLIAGYQPWLHGRCYLVDAS